MDKIIKSINLSNDSLDRYLNSLLGFSDVIPPTQTPEEILISWAKRKFEPVLLHLLFNQDNYRIYTRPQLCKEMNFTPSLVLPYFISQRALHRIDKILFDRDLTKQTTELELINDAKRSLVLLDERLAKRKSFFPSEKNHTDAVIFVYLSKLLTHELVDRNLRAHVRGCKNLMTFLSHFALTNHLVDPTLDITNSEAEDENKVTAYTVPILVTAMACLLFASVKKLIFF